MVTTRAGAAPDLLEDGTHALLVAFADGAALAAGAARLLDDPALRQRLAANARAVAEAYEWSRVVAAYGDLVLRATGHDIPRQSTPDPEPHNAVSR
jgi:glycosyltransferase involved in cell wall biosynthesis